MKKLFFVMMTLGTQFIGHTPAHASSTFTAHSLERASYEATWNDENGLQVKCYDFNRFAVVTLPSEGAGTGKFQIRYPGLKFRGNRCNRSFAGKTKILNGDFAGVKNNYVFSFQGYEQMNLNIDDAFTSRSYLSEGQVGHTPITVREKNGTLEVEFVKVFKSLLSGECSLNEDKTCWETFLRVNEVPDSVHLEKPDCQKPAESVSALSIDPIDADAYIGAKVRVKDLKHPKIEYQSIRAVYCHFRT